VSKDVDWLPIATEAFDAYDKDRLKAKHKRIDLHNEDLQLHLDRGGSFETFEGEFKCFIRDGLEGPRGNNYNEQIIASVIPYLIPLICKGNNG
jgi:hypothetical protein